MNNNFILFFLSYFIILTSTLGYGLLFSGIFEKRNNYNFGHIGLIGIFFLILYSYFSNIFLAHSETAWILSAQKNAAEGTVHELGVRITVFREMLDLEVLKSGAEALGTAPRR